MFCFNFLVQKYSKYFFVHQLSIITIAFERFFYIHIEVIESWMALLQWEVFELSYVVGGNVKPWQSEQSEQYVLIWYFISKLTFKQ